MGVGQSQELALCAESGHATFAHENAEELKRFMVRLNDTAEFVARRQWLDSHRRGNGASAEKDGHTILCCDAADDDDNDEAEERAMWQPFTHILVANHYMNDAALLEPFTVSYFHKTTSDGNEAVGTRSVPMNALDILSRDVALQTLDLGFNHLTAGVMAPLVAALQPLHQLRVLSLAGNAIGKAGCAHLGRYLAANPILERLTLQQCSLCDADIVPLLQGLSNATTSSIESTTTEQSANHSSASSRRSVTTTVENAPNTHLRYLNLDFNDLTDLSVRRFLYLVYCEQSRRSSGHSTSTTATETTRDAFNAVQMEADASVKCVGSGNSTLAVLLYESCPHDRTTMRVLEPFVYMSGRRLEYACTPAGYFRSGSDYRPDALFAAAGTHSSSSADATRTSASTKHSSNNPTVDAATTLPTSHPPPPLHDGATPFSLPHSRSRVRSGSIAATDDGELLATRTDGHSLSGPVHTPEIVYYEGNFVEDELAVVSESQRKEAARERHRLRKAMLRHDFAGLHPFDPFLRRHLAALLSKRRVAYEQELRQQRRALIEKLAVVTAGEEAEEAEGVAAASAHLHRVASGTTVSVSTASMAPHDTDDVQWHAPAADAQASLEGVHEDGQGGEGSAHAGARHVLVDVRRPRRSTQGRSRKLLGDEASMGKADRTRDGLGSPARLETVMREADVFREKHLKPGTVTRSGLEHRVAPNGLDKVLLAASTHGAGGGAVAAASASAIPRDRQQNQLVNKTRPNRLHACWCDPQDASLLYGGVLHYHCVREGAVLYGGAAEAGRGAARESGAQMPKAGPSSHRGKRTAASDTEASRARDVVQQRKLAYRACQGTGHRCVSGACVPARNGAGALPLLAAAKGPVSSAAIAAAAATATTTSLPNISASSSRQAHRTVHTDQSGLTVALNYNPVEYFSSAYVPSAVIVDECAM